MHHLHPKGALTYVDCVWLSVFRRVRFAIAKAVGRQLSSPVALVGDCATSGGPGCQFSHLVWLVMKGLDTQGARHQSHIKRARVEDTDFPLGRPPSPWSPGGPETKVPD